MAFCEHCHRISGHSIGCPNDDTPDEEIEDLKAEEEDLRFDTARDDRLTGDY